MVFVEWYNKIAQKPMNVRDIKYFVLLGLLNLQDCTILDLTALTKMSCHHSCHEFWPQYHLTSITCAQPGCSDFCNVLELDVPSSTDSSRMLRQPAPDRIFECYLPLRIVGQENVQIMFQDIMTKADIVFSSWGTNIRHKSVTVKLTT